MIETSSSKFVYLFVFIFMGFFSFSFVFADDTTVDWNTERQKMIDNLPFAPGSTMIFGRGRWQSSSQVYNDAEILWVSDTLGTANVPSVTNKDCSNSPTSFSGFYVTAEWNWTLVHNCRKGVDRYDNIDNIKTYIWNPTNEEWDEFFANPHSYIYFNSNKFYSNIDIKLYADNNPDNSDSKVPVAEWGDVIYSADNGVVYNSSYNLIWVTKNKFPSTTWQASGYHVLLKSNQDYSFAVASYYPYSTDEYTRVVVRTCPIDYLELSDCSIDRIDYINEYKNQHSSMSYNGMIMEFINGTSSSSDFLRRIDIEGKVGSSWHSFKFLDLAVSIDDVNGDSGNGFDVSEVLNNQDDENQQNNKWYNIFYTAIVDVMKFLFVPHVDKIMDFYDNFFNSDKFIGFKFTSDLLQFFQNFPGLSDTSCTSVSWFPQKNDVCVMVQPVQPLLIDLIYLSVIITIIRRIKYMFL